MDLQDTYVDFLQNSLLAMAIDSGADLKGLPLQLMEPREIEVPMEAENEDIVGRDFQNPGTLELMKTMDFQGDNLNRTQLAMMSLLPPHERILGLVRHNFPNAVVDMEHVKKRMREQAQKHNKNAGTEYVQRMLRAALGMQILSVDGYDPSFEVEPAPKNPPKFVDPVSFADQVPDHVFTTHHEMASPMSLTEHGRQMARPRTNFAMHAQFEKVLQQVCARREGRGAGRARGMDKSYVQALADLEVTRDIENILLQRHQERRPVGMRP